ncbi:PAS domain S-box protein [Amycolatopsis umgeniensis]|uniref:Oxygen sensor histidine kinase NreB n=1 Tax=Amycolatopsis umgeniensis TaxID=336628 RepID=A0A841AVR5_9PSEU|nr:PAS domain-containing sensor histidine kinase [Amycolatopsis umgeniensis]MBB5850374.1 PAS domain S-box-containing protein [Amycolatopsis umgeniensis]
MAKLPSEQAPDHRNAVLFELFVHSVVDYAIYMLDVDGRVISWNPGAERIKGYSEEEILGRNFSVFYTEDDVADGKPATELLMAAEVGSHEDEGWRVRSGGERFWANTVITALRDEEGTLVGFGKVTRDLTERRKSQEEKTGRRQAFAHLVRAQETERRRIAWDVHDDSIQSMIAVSMRLQMLAAQRRDSALMQLDDAIQGAIRRLRILVAQLRPPALNDEDLIASVRDYLDEVVGGWGLDSTLRHDFTAKPPPDFVVTAFRILQEALVNVRKHANATAVAVSLAGQDGGLLAEVADNGDGMKPGGETSHEALSGEHIGMASMRERAEAAQGWFRVSSKPGEGTSVAFWIPLASPGVVRR